MKIKIRKYYITRLVNDYNSSITNKSVETFQVIILFLLFLLE